MSLSISWILSYVGLTLVIPSFPIIPTLLSSVVTIKSPFPSMYSIDLYLAVIITLLSFDRLATPNNPVDASCITSKLYSNAFSLLKII